MGNHILREEEKKIKAAFAFLVGREGFAEPSIEWLGDPHGSARGFRFVYESSQGLQIRIATEVGQLLPYVVVALPRGDIHFWIDYRKIVSSLNLPLDSSKFGLAEKAGSMGCLGLLLWPLAKTRLRREYSYALSHYADLLEENLRKVMDFAQSDDSKPFRVTIPVSSL